MRGATTKLPVCADAGYTGVEKHEEHAGRQVIWQVAG